jgi:hypothetical protein
MPGDIRPAISSSAQANTMNTRPANLLSLLALLLASTALWAAEPWPSAKDPASLGFIKGMTWGWVGSRGDYASPAAADSMKKLAATGSRWVCIAFAPNMKTYDTPGIKFGDANPNMATDDEIRHAVGLARQNGLKVMFKPVVNCSDDVWRAWIRFYRPVTDEEKTRGITGVFDPWGEKPQQLDGTTVDTEKWNQWWTDFDAYILHYAKIADQEHVPVYCLGCEMNSTEEFEDHWRSLIARVRDVYHGLITYDVNHDGEEKVKWFDSVDFISVSAYHPIPFADGRPLEDAAKQTEATPTAEIVAAMKPIRQRLARVSAKWGKPILFIETGVTPIRGCARTPWEHVDESIDRPIDQREQANYYEAQFETYWNEPWFMGWCWWEWPARLYDKADAARDREFCIYGKQAEDVLRQWYAKPH